MIPPLALILAGLFGAINGLPSPDSTASNANCFPAIGFSMPASTPSSLNGWWCNRNEEYGFVGFSYSVAACQDLGTLKREFKDIRHSFDGRYVRIYGTCDRSGFYDDVVNAAWEAGVGVHALIWFGFDGNDAWKTRKSRLVSTLLSNPKAKFVTRVVQFGSEPLYDWAIDVNQLASELWSLKGTLSSLSIPVTISEMAYGYQVHGGAQSVMDAVNMIDAHTLPFFSSKATTARNSWPLVQTDLDWFIAHGQGKKIYLSENGWPSVSTSILKSESPSAVANVQNEADYYSLLDSKCSYFKSVAGGGVGWFAHLYSDSQQLGYGIYDAFGHLKFAFKPRTAC